MKRQSIRHQFTFRNGDKDWTIREFQRALETALKAGVPLDAKLTDSGWDATFLAEWEEGVG